MAFVRYALLVRSRSLGSWLALMASGLAGVHGGCAPSKDPQPAQPRGTPVATVPSASSRGPNDGAAAEPSPAVPSDAGSAAAGPAGGEAGAIAEPMAVHPSGAGTLRAGGASVGSVVPSAAQVVRQMHPGFRRCYARALAKDPDHAGVLMVRLELDANGSVTHARAEPRQGMSEALLRCIEAVARRAQFAPPEGGQATLTIPLTLQPKP